MSYINFSNNRKKIHSEESANSRKKFRIATLATGSFNQTYQTVEVGKDLYYTQL